MVSGRCPSTVRPVFPVLVFQLKVSNRTVIGQPPQPYSEPSKSYSDKEILFTHQPESIAK